MDNAPNEVPSWVHYPKEILKLLALNNFLWYNNFCVILLLCKKSKDKQKIQQKYWNTKMKMWNVDEGFAPALFHFWGNSQSLTCFDTFFVPLSTQFCWKEFLHSFTFNEYYCLFLFYFLNTWKYFLYIKSTYIPTYN